MKENSFEQLLTLIQKSRRVLITSRGQATGDGLASCLAFSLLLKKAGKNADIVIDGFNGKENYSFLAGFDNIKPVAGKIKKFALTVDISQTGIEGLSYDIKGNELKIYLTPKQGQFEPEDIHLESGEFAYDLIIALGVADLEELGRLYDFHRDVFFKIPLVNIDCDIHNEQYGHLNIVDITASSVSEIIFAIIQAIMPEKLDAAIATCLLAGMIEKTQSFKSANVSPQALLTASRLMELGADRKEIVAKLYQTKTISMLKLWGKILSKLQIEPENKIAWSTAEATDFRETNATAKEIPLIIDELLSLNPQAETIILFYYIAEDKTGVILKTQGPVSALSLARVFSPVGDKHQVSFSLPDNLPEAEEKVLWEIRKGLSGLNGF